MAIVSYKCPNCGGGLAFDPESGQYRCEYCLSDFTQQKLEEMTPAMESSQSAMLYHCPSCGAEIVTDETTAAAFCFYCHNPVVLSGRLEGQYHPDYVLPFAVDREKAVEIFSDWVRKKRYVPKAFFSKKQIEKMSGVYFPYWLYSCKVDGKLEGEGVKLRTWVAGNLQYTETQKYEIRRAGHMNINRVPRNALKKADRLLVEGVLPFNMKELRPFSMGYLSGFMAEKRDLEKQEFSEELEKEVKDFAISGLQNSVAEYQKMSVLNKNADIRDEKWQYALMPVWTLTYRDHNGKICYFACNGQTGKVCGQLPVDMGRLMILFAEVFVPLLAALLIVGYLL